jgi:O-antigen ligase
VFNVFNLAKIYQFLLIVLAFLMPISVSLANFIIVIIVLLWIFTGSFRVKLNEIFASKFLIASMIFYFLHLLGMIWTDDFEWGLHMLHKMWYFILLLPILYTIVKKSHIKYYIFAFLSAIAITEIFSYLVWFEIIDEFRKAYHNNPTPFMSHISYNPYLAFSIYLVVHELLFNQNNRLQVFFYSFFSFIMVINMFITGGRAGQVMFFMVVVILCIQYFRNNYLKASLAIIILIPSIFLFAYHSSPLFQERIKLVVSEIVNYDIETITGNQMVNSSIGARILFTSNSLEIIKNNPFIGVGTGDFPNEYKKINENNSPNGPNVKNPHNMYVLILVELGIIGLISMLSIFYYQIKFSKKQDSVFLRDLGLTLPILFLVIMFSDSYLLGHFTSLLFVFFSSFLYKDFERS